MRKYSGAEGFGTAPLNCRRMRRECEGAVIKGVGWDRSSCLASRIAGHTWLS